MATDSEVIRSFLVSVGVDLDEQGMKRFDRAVDDITKTVTELGKAAVVAALAVSGAVVKIAGEFEDLFYASQRLKSSVDNIKAFSFGVSQMGGDAKAARASLESFASFMRSNPMGEGVVRGLGVETRTSTGEMREYADVLRDVGGQLRMMPYWAAKQRANLLGLDENTLQALLRGTDLWSDRYRKLVKDSGVNMDQMAEDFTALMQRVRLLRVELEIYLYKALKAVDPELLEVAAALGVVGGALALVNLLLGPEVALVLALGAAIVVLTNDFNEWKAGADSFIPWEQWADDIDNAVATISDLLDALNELGGALSGVGAWWSNAFGPAVSLLISIAVIPLRALVDLIRTLAALLTGDMPLAWANFKKTGVDAIDGIITAGDRLRRFLATLAGKPAEPPSATGPSSQARAAARSKGANDNAMPATRNAQDQALAYFMRQGWTREQALGIVAGSFAESGLKPGNRNPTSGAYGIGQWLGSRVKDFERVMGKPLEGSSLQDQLAFMQWELRNTEKRAGSAIAGTSSAHDALSAFVTKYERPKLGAETDGDLARGGRFLAANTKLGTDGGARTVTINAKTDVKVSGAVDAQAAGKAVGDSVDRRNSELVRNTRSAVR